LCNSADVELAVPIKASPIADAYLSEELLSQPQELYPLDLYLCGACGHVQLLEIVDPNVLFGNYIYTTSSSSSLVQHFREYAEDTMRRFPCAPDSLVVDIGSNDGTLLSFFKDHGKRVLGVDPAVRIAEEATARGVRTVPAFFQLELAREIRRDDGPAVFVTANNVFAHSDNLPEMADAIRELLADDGVFIFEVSYLIDILEKKLFDTVYHEHLCYHSIRPLVSFFLRHGLELFDLKRLPSKGGSIRGFVQKKDGPRKIHPIVAELLNLELQMELGTIGVFRKFTAALELLKSELQWLLYGEKQEGRTIVGYGASATVTTLIYNFELAPFLAFIVDDNPLRHNLFSPGHHIKILPPTVIYSQKPDAVIILAWQYAGAIMAKNGKYLDNGGRLILPLPKPRVMASGSGEKPIQ
jgi:SAM-dependent methyltransferase